jgi:hypothetical protein
MKAESLNAKVKELKLKEQSMNQMIPMQAYNKLKAHLDAITSRHQAFRDMIINGENFSQNSLTDPNKANPVIKFHEPPKAWSDHMFKENHDISEFMLNSAKQDSNTSKAKPSQILTDSFKSNRDDFVKNDMVIFCF